MATTKASNNALPDESPPWDQISFASKVYVDALRKEQWPDQHVRALIKFFSELDYQRTPLTSDPDRIFIEYQATVRRQWTDFDFSDFSLQATSNSVPCHHARGSGCPCKQLASIHGCTGCHAELSLTAEYLQSLILLRNSNESHILLSTF